MIWSDFFWRDVFPRLDLARVFESLQPKLSQTGKYYHVQCPRCKKHEAYAFTDKGNIVCNRANNCGGTICGDVLEFRNGGPVAGEAMVSTITALAGLAGVAIPEREWTEEEKAAWIAGRKQTNAQRVFADSTRQNDCGRSYLAKRGIRDDIAISFEIGYIADVRTLDIPFDTLVEMGFGYTSSEGETRLNTLWNNRVYGPIREPGGQIVGYWGRSVDEHCDPKHKIIYTSSEISKGLAFGLYKLKSDYVCIVEGIFDALRLRSCGIPAVATLGTFNRLNADRWGQLSKAGVIRAILFTDADKAGIGGLSSAIQSYCVSQEAPEVYVIDPDLYKRFGKDPDEIASRIGESRLKQLLNRHERAWSYRARDMARDTDLAVPANLDLYVERCVDVIHRATKAKREAVSLYFVPRVCDIAGCDQSALFEAQRRLDDKALAGRIAELAQAHEFTAISDAIISRDADAAGSKTQPIITVAEYIPQLDNWLAGFAGRKHIGLVQRSLPTLDDLLSGFRGITLLAAKTNVGKTMFLIQTIASLLVANPDVCFVFVSIDMPKETIASRFIAHFGAINWEDMAMGSNRKYNELAPFSDDDIRRRNYGRECLLALGQRLLILDQSNAPNITAERILIETNRLQEKTGCARSGIAIDMLPLLSVPDDIAMRYRSPIDREQWQMERCVWLRDKRNGDVVFAVDETRKGEGRSGSKLNLSPPVTVDDVMGSSRKSYAADAILVYNQLNDADLYSYFVLPEDMSGIATRAESIDFGKGDDTIELRRNIRRMHVLMDDRGWNYGTLTVAKVRDAGRRDVIELTNWFKQSRFEEGFRDDATRRFITEYPYEESLDTRSLLGASTRRT